MTSSYGFFFFFTYSPLFLSILTLYHCYMHTIYSSCTRAILKNSISRIKPHYTLNYNFLSLSPLALLDIYLCDCKQTNTQLICKRSRKTKGKLQTTFISLHFTSFQFAFFPAFISFLPLLFPRFFFFFF